MRFQLVKKVTHHFWCLSNSCCCLKKIFCLCLGIKATPLHRNFGKQKNVQKKTQKITCILTLQNHFIIPTEVYFKQNLYHTLVIIAGIYQVLIMHISNSLTTILQRKCYCLLKDNETEAQKVWIICLRQPSLWVKIWD